MMETTWNRISSPTLWVSTFRDDKLKARVQFDVFRLDGGFDAYISFEIIRLSPDKKSYGKCPLDVTVHDLDKSKAREEIKTGSLAALTLSEMNALAHVLRTIVDRVDGPNMKFIERGKKDSPILKCLLN